MEKDNTKNAQFHYLQDLENSDPGFVSLFENFAFEEAGKTGNLDRTDTALAILACLIGSDALDLFEKVLFEALENGISAMQAKELVYQAAAYCGIGRIYPFLNITNAVMEKKGISLPLPDGAAVNPETRLSAGIQAQVDIFGEGMRDYWKSGPEEEQPVHYFLAANCFGDYYTRKYLSLKQREMITFCLLAAMGGCEPQLTSHAAGNLNIGNSKEFLFQVLYTCTPYLGYPRTLNAIACVQKAAKSN
jgi:4-carboxymuconolactone decarboxylase